MTFVVLNEVVKLDLRAGTLDTSLRGLMFTLLTLRS